MEHDLTEIQYTDKDYEAANLLHGQPTRRGWAVLAVIVVGLLVADYLITRSLLETMRDGMLILVAVFLLFIGFLIYTPRAARRTFEKQPLAHLPQQFSLRSDGLEIRSSRGNSLLQWHDFIRWRTNRHTTLLYLAPRLFILVPSRIAEAGFPLEELKSKLMQKLGPPMQ